MILDRPPGALACALSAALAASSPAAAHAQSASTNAESDANALLRQADAAFEVRDFARALQLFRRAYERQQDPTILYNVATMYAALEQWADAIATWRLYLERVPDAPNRPTTLASIRDAEARLRSAPTGVVPPTHRRHPAGRHAARADVLDAHPLACRRVGDHSCRRRVRRHWRRVAGPVRGRRRRAREPRELQPAHGGRLRLRAWRARDS
jgi:tetratricopeptide (TPR) repeat protein